jgi:hypothetical protein
VAKPQFDRVSDVRLGTFPNWTEAEMFAQILRSEGIPTVLIPLAPFDGWGSSTWAAHEVRVAAKDAERAGELLTEWREGAGDVVLPGEG